VPLQDPGLAVRELEYIVHELKLPAIEVPSHIEGDYLGHQRFRAFWEAAQDLDLLVFVHPDEPYNIGVDRMREYYLHNLLGNPIDTARCIADVVFSGLLEAYPSSSCCSHTAVVLFHLSAPIRARLARSPGAQGAY